MFKKKPEHIFLLPISEFDRNSKVTVFLDNKTECMYISLFPVRLTFIYKKC